jgi:hypothetical protein
MFNLNQLLIDTYRAEYHNFEIPEPSMCAVCGAYYKTNHGHMISSLGGHYYVQPDDVMVLYRMKVRAGREVPIVDILPLDRLKELGRL